MSALSIEQIRIEQIRKEFEKMPEAPWVTEMKLYYQKHGYYRAKDLLRLLGDPRESVTVKPRGADGKVPIPDKFLHRTELPQE